MISKYVENSWQENKKLARQSCWFVLDMQFRIITESHVIFYSEIRIAIEQMTTELTDTIEYNNSELFIINCQSSLSTHVIGPVEWHCSGHHFYRFIY